jgi:FkbM family methyltransferase
MLKSICEASGIEFDDENKIKIKNKIKHIKLDIGLSYGAPQSQSWLTRESDLIVFGFEPNPDSVSAIKSPENKKRDACHGDVLEYKYLNDTFYVIPIALSDSTDRLLPFYVTSGDAGCSSLMKPKLSALPSNIGLESVIQVPIFRLSDFFDLFPFDKFPIIEYIKIDAQGSDLAIIKSGGGYIRDHVVYVTLEPESNQYEGSEQNTTHEISNYMISIGFERIQHTNTIDPTFVNTKFKSIASSIFISQI